MQYGPIAVAAVLAATSASFGAAWTPANGSTAHFSYANGQNSKGFFGNGMATDEGFFFTPTTFKSSATGVGSNLTDDTASVELTAPVGETFSSISAHLFGDYTILGNGGASGVGTITVTDLDSTLFIGNGLTTTGLPVLTLTSASGNFSAAGTTVLPAGWSHIRVEFTAAVNSVAGSNGSSLVQIKDADIGVSLAPEPASLAAIAGGTALLGTRRRHRGD